MEEKRFCTPKDDTDKKQDDTEESMSTLYIATTDGAIWILMHNNEFQ